MKLYQNQNLHVKISGFSFHVSVTIETARPILSKSWQRAFSLYWAKQARFCSFFFAPFFTPRDPGEALEGPQVVKVKPGDATLVVGKL